MAENSNISWTDKWCTACKMKHPTTSFGKDKSRGDGLAARCIASRSTGRPRGWHGKPNINPITGLCGPAPKPPEDGNKKQARQRVNVEVRTKRRPHPNSIPCADCGHIHSEGERRHEYDHHLGYSKEHHLDVESVCTICHNRRERERER